MSQNSQTLFDEDGETPDWFELYNTADTGVSLLGYGISDKSGQPFLWTFPDIYLGPGEYIRIFASDKDRKAIPTFFDTYVTAGDSFSYLIPSGPVEAWYTSGFNDSGWIRGRSGFGYGDNDDSTSFSTKPISVYFRTHFQLDDLNKVKQMVFHMDFDDGFVAYLNGHELARFNLGAWGTIPDWNSAAIDHEARMWQGGTPEMFQADSLINYLLAGENTLAVEVHNTSTASSDMSGTPFLTLGMITPPSNPRGTPPFIQMQNSQLHTNFKLSSSGDSLFLTNPLGVLVDSMSFGELSRDISAGRQPDGVDSRFYFAEPTPGTANTSKAYNYTAFADVKFSSRGGFYTGPVYVGLTGAGPQDTIWYTTNGSEPKPGPTSTQFKSVVNFTNTTVVRATISGPDHMPGRIATRTFIIRNPKPVISTVSLSTKPANFFDYNTGIYELGPNAEQSNPNFGANFWEDWERPIHFEIFEKDGTPAYEADGGVKIFGAWSRANPQKSLAFYARGSYGYQSFDYKFFNLPISNKYHNFILRNSGNDFNNTQFRDAMMQGLMDGTAVDRMAYRPVSVYLNGQYWGVMEMREKINEYYLAAHHNVDPTQLDLLEVQQTPVVGDPDSYFAMISYLESHSASTKSVYDSITKWIDLENYIDYQLGQIYFNNTDWPGNNIKYWRPKAEGGKWRWIMYDTDFGFGIWNVGDYNNNTLAFALDPYGPGWPNPPWSTFLFRKVTENLIFKRRFALRFADMMNSNFSYQNILQNIDQKAAELDAEMPFHGKRWGLGYNTWTGNVNNMRLFGKYRNGKMFAYIRDQFGLNNYDTLTVETSEPLSGTIDLNTLKLNAFPWKGVYFYNLGIPITARPNPGYRFVRWEGPVVNANAASTAVQLTRKDKVKAIFEKDETNISDVVINEINYNTSPLFDPEDWVELYNKGQYTIDLSGWILKDEDILHRFVIPQGTMLYPDDYLVLSRVSSKFVAAYPSKRLPLGDFIFGLGSTSDCVRLLTADSLLVDSVLYTSSSPWPLLADVAGASLELISPQFDNAVAVSWKASPVAHGTPGEKNGAYKEVNIYEEKGIVAGELFLEQNFPNPFDITTCIRYVVPEDGHVKLTVYDLQGRLISVLKNDRQDPGRYELYWDGTSGGGDLLPSGAYVLKLEMNGVRASRMMSIMR